MCRECEHKMQNTPERRARRRELEKQRRENPEYVKERNMLKQDILTLTLLKRQ